MGTGLLTCELSRGYNSFVNLAANIIMISRIKRDKCILIQYFLSMHLSIYIYGFKHKSPSNILLAFVKCASNNFKAKQKFFL